MISTTRKFIKEDEEKKDKVREMETGKKPLYIKLAIVLILGILLGSALGSLITVSFLKPQQLASTTNETKLEGYSEKILEILKNSTGPSLTPEQIAQIQYYLNLASRHQIPPWMWHSPPQTWIEPGSEVETASYIIFGDGQGNYYAKSGWNGSIMFSGTNAATVIQNTINALPNGGKILIKEGVYAFYNKINFYTSQNIWIEGEGKPTIRAMFDGSLFEFTALTTDTPRSRMVIKNLVLDLNGHAGHGFYGAVTDSIFENIECYNIKTYAYFNLNATRTRFEDITMYGSSTQTWSNFDCTLIDSVMINVHSLSAYYVGIWLNKASNVKITGLKVIGGGTSGTAFGGEKSCRNIYVDGFEFGNGVFGIYFQDTSNPSDNIQFKNGYIHDFTDAMHVASGAVSGLIVENVIGYNPQPTSTISVAASATTTIGPYPYPIQVILSSPSGATQIILNRLGVNTTLPVQSSYYLYPSDKLYVTESTIAQTAYIIPQ